jgi:two-component system NarL family sensor kinase
MFAGILWLLVALVGVVLGGIEMSAAGEPLWHAGVDAVILLLPATVGAALALWLPDNPVGWLLLSSTSATAVATVAGHWAEHNPTATGAVWAAWVDAVFWALGPPLLPLIALVFPDGRPFGRAGRWGVRAGAAGVVVIALGSAFLPGPTAGQSVSPGPDNPLGLPVPKAVNALLLGGAVLLVGTAAALAAFSLVQRWRRGTGTERLALAAAGTPLVLALALALAGNAIGASAEPVAIAAGLVAAIGVPVGIWLAVTRHRLYELDLAIARTLGYALLTVALVVLFSLTAAIAGAVIGARSPGAAAVAAAVTATALAPARAWVLAVIQRSLLGPAGDPERAAELVDRRLAAVEDADLLAARAADTVADVLGLPAVVVLSRGQHAPGPLTVSFPLRHHGIELGVLGVSGPATRGARRALARVAGPVAAALHSASLADAVRRSRADLLAAVEEERRRLRRDLHDGLGPQLATLAMGLDAAANRIAATAQEPLLGPLLGRLRGQTDQMLTDLRQVVAGLRPPALDELGLIGALRLHADDVAEPAGLTVEVIAEDLGALTAAVEVAAYRIAAEALLNAARHSQGQRCRLTLVRDHGLWLSITDDGRGMPDHCPSGVGTQSMRERAAALGGWVAIVPAAQRGTEVRAWLPAVPA